METPGSCELRAGPAWWDECLTPAPPLDDGVREPSVLEVRVVERDDLKLPAELFDDLEGQLVESARVFAVGVGQLL
jgi:hypothetical protein